MGTFKSHKGCESDPFPGFCPIWSNYGTHKIKECHQIGFMGRRRIVSVIRASLCSKSPNSQIGIFGTVRTKFRKTNLDYFIQGDLVMPIENFLTLQLHIGSYIFDK